MNKSILKAVAVSAVAVMFSLGCSDPDGGGTGTDDPQQNPNSDKYTLTISATSGGSVSPAVGTHSYDAGKSVTVTATANDGYTFSKWSGASESKDTAITITMNGNKTLNASFERKSVTQPFDVNDIVGDWLDVGMFFGDYYGKTILSYESNGQFAIRTFEHIGYFWIQGYPTAESDDVCQIKWKISGDTILTGAECEGGYYEPFFAIPLNNVIISGDTLKINDGDMRVLSVRVNLETFKSSLGDSLKIQDPALYDTRWLKLESDDEWGCGIGFFGNYSDCRNVYIPESYDATWYTEEGNRLTLVSLKCDRWGEEEHGGYYDTVCVATSIETTVTLDYQLTNGTLRLKAPGKDWDVWTPSNDMYKSKAKSEKDRRSINPLFKVSKK